jgi:chaperonin cofactor prefoldin
MIRRVLMLWWLCAVFDVSADTIRLKSGDTLEGEVVSETDTHYEIRVSSAGGTIFKTERVAKADVAEVLKLSEDERRQQAAARDYEKTKIYRLNPSNSYPLSFYDQVLREQFGRFLETYPDSMYVEDVKMQMDLWKSEREMVSAGKVKIEGRWYTTEEFAQEQASLRVKQGIGQVKMYLEAGRADVAVQQIKSLEAMNLDLLQKAEVRILKDRVYRSWLPMLEREKSALEARRTTIETQLAKTRQSLAEAQSKLASAPASSGGTQKLGEGSMRMHYQAEVNRHQTEVQRIERSLAGVQKQLTAVEGNLTEARSVLGMKQPGAEGGDVAAAKPVDPKQPWVPPFLGEIWSFVTNYWYYLLAAVFLIGYVIYRTVIK